MTDQGWTRPISTCAVILTIVIGLVGCAGQDAPSTSPSSASTTGTSSKPSPTPVPTAVAAPMKWGVHCKVLDAAYSTTADGRYASVEEAWADGRPWNSCEAFVMSGEAYTDIQRAAVAAAGYQNISSLDTLYGLCAEVAGPYVTRGIVSDAQAQEVSGMLTLCPNFPAAAPLLAASAAAQQAAAERIAGTRVGGGVFDIGTGIQPGLYQSTGSVENCYWERLDAAGEVIDNNFVGAANQVQITVEPSDFSLHIAGCGELARIG